MPAIIAGHSQLSISVAFVSRSGLDEIRTPLLDCLNKGGRIRCIVDLTQGNTDPSALWDLLSMRADHPSQLDIRTYLDEDGGILHSKLFIGTAEEDDAEVITGSANISHAALYDNIEHGILVAGERDEGVIADSISYFDLIWASDTCKPIDEEAARLYESYAGRRRVAQNRAQRKAKTAWRNLARHLAKTGAQGFVWPSAEAAFLMGVIAARGTLLPDDKRLEIGLLFNPGAYKDERIAVRSVSYKAREVLPTIPQEVARRANELLPEATITIEGYTVAIDLSKEPNAFNAIRAAFDPALDAHAFSLPRGLMLQDESIVSEFVKGFAVACALLTDGTSMPRNPRTGMSGQMVVWLRPKKANQLLFDQLYELVQRRLGMTVYRHERIDRDPHLKIPCEDFAELGFGIDWWDALVNEGAVYNFSLFPQIPLDL